VKLARHLLVAFPFALCLCAGAAIAADAFPARPIKIVVPYPPGGSADLIGRMVAEKMTRSIGQPVIVENKGGATGAIGSEFVARSAPDGYTLLVGIADTHAINPAVVPKLSYDPIKDFAPVSLLATQPFLLAVGPSVAARTLAEYVAAAKAKPGALTFASNGAGGLQHLAMELFDTTAGIKALHVPYKGAAPALADVTGGQVDAILISIQGAGGLLRTKLRPLAIVAPSRLAVAPDIPTFAESGFPNFNVSQWYALFAPAGTPKEVLDKLTQHARAAMKSADVSEKLKSVGTEPDGSSAEDLRVFLAGEVRQWAEVAKSVDVKIQ
jgi:tripartite-type tricarboxylate transporter receptor subunit TctC